MTWYIVVRDTDKGREYLCDDGSFAYVWYDTLDWVSPELFDAKTAQTIAAIYNGYVVALKEVTP